MRDLSPEEFKANVMGLAKTAETLGLPVLMTTSRDWGPNGPIVPELKALFSDAEVIRRPGVINAYRYPPFREALEATGRKKAIIAGVSSSTCLQFPALDMVLDGYDVHGVIDASGSESQIARQASIATLAQAGVKVRTWFSVAAELVADWRRDEANGWPLAAGAVREHNPSWGHLLDIGMAHATGGWSRRRSSRRSRPRIGVSDTTKDRAGGPRRQPAVAGGWGHDKRCGDRPERPTRSFRTDLEASRAGIALMQSLWTRRRP